MMLRKHNVDVEQRTMMVHVLREHNKCVACTQRLGSFLTCGICGGRGSASFDICVA
jgi:hypothetical protein